MTPKALEQAIEYLNKHMDMEETPYIYQKELAKVMVGFAMKEVAGRQSREQDVWKTMYKETSETLYEKNKVIASAIYFLSGEPSEENVAEALAILTASEIPAPIVEEKMCVCGHKKNAHVVLKAHELCMQDDCMCDEFREVHPSQPIERESKP